MSQENHRQDAEPAMERRILRSIFSELIFPPEKDQPKRFLLRNLLLHFRPTSVPEKTLRLSLTWGLGGMAVVLVLLQFGTGILLKFVYEPTPVAAYASVHTIISSVPFGRLIRNMHHWAAHLLVVVAFLHFLRVFLTGAFHPPRQWNWIIGLFMFICLLAANLTGYLLPWDQLAFWAVTVSTGMFEYIPFIGIMLQEVIRGGTEIGPTTLRHFFALHTAVIPMILLSLMAFHFWRVRKAGGLVVPRSPQEPADPKPVRVASVPNLLLREATTAMVLIAALLLFSTFADAPLGNPANPGLSPNPTRAPWYFAGLQELLLHLQPVVAVCVIPALMFVGLLAIPYLSYEANTSGVWFASRIGRRTAIPAAVMGLVATPLLILAAESIVIGKRFPVSLPSWLLGGVLPLCLLAAVMFVFQWVLKRRYGATKHESIQAVLILLVAAYGVLTIIGVVFRGEGMSLALPW